VNESQRLTGANRVLNKAMLVHLSKSVTTVYMFLCWKMNLLHIFNIVKNMTLLEADSKQ